MVWLPSTFAFLSLLLFFWLRFPRNTKEAHTFHSRPLPSFASPITRTPRRQLLSSSPVLYSAPRSTSYGAPLTTTSPRLLAPMMLAYTPPCTKMSTPVPSTSGPSTRRAHSASRSTPSEAPTAPPSSGKSSRRSHTQTSKARSG